MQTEFNQNSGHSGDAEKAAGERKEIGEAIYSLDFAIRKSIRYHSKRRRFFDNWHDCSNALAAITGSSVFVALLSKNTDMALYLSAIVAAATACDVVLGLSKRSQLHDNLQRKFSMLLGQIILNEPSRSNLLKWQSERVEIEQDEPTFLTLLVDVCHNEESIAKGNHDFVLKGISMWRRWLSDWISFDGFHEELVRRKHSPHGS